MQMRVLFRGNMLTGLICVDIVVTQHNITDKCISSYLHSFVVKYIIQLVLIKTRSSRVQIEM